MKAGFPNSIQLLCTRHLKQNVDNQLTDKIGTQYKDRKAITELIFGKDGLCDSETDTVFQERKCLLLDTVEQLAPSFSNYLENHLIPTLKTYVIEPFQNDYCSNNWTNNNCESINNVLKEVTERKKNQPL